MKPEQLWDAELLNRIANEPRNQQQLGFTDIDLSGFFQRPGNVAIGTQEGVGMFAYLGDGRWEGHYLFSHESRTTESLDLAREILDVMFTKLDASAILGQTPESNLPALRLTRALGFTPVGTSTTPSGRSCVNSKLERSQWEALSEASLAVSEASSAPTNRRKQPSEPSKQP